jgi:hypothetical protein
MCIAGNLKRPEPLAACPKTTIPLSNFQKKLMIKTATLLTKNINDNLNNERVFLANASFSYSN